MARIGIKDLLEAGVHFGHQTKRWNPKMKDYVFGKKNGIYIIDLTKTMHQIANASNFLQEKVMNGGSILFVGTKRQSQEVVKEAAQKTGMFHVTERWLGGTLTNNTTIKKSVARMLEADKVIANPESSNMKKKEISSLHRENLKHHKNLDGIVAMKNLPAALVIVDICKEEIAVREARKLKIPVVAIVDTNADPDEVNFPIIANDDAVRSIKTIIDVLAESIAYANEVYKRTSAERIAAAEAERAEHQTEEGESKDKKRFSNRKPRSEGDKSRKPAPRERKPKEQSEKPVEKQAEKQVEKKVEPVKAAAVEKKAPKAKKAEKTEEKQSEKK